VLRVAWGCRSRVSLWKNLEVQGDEIRGQPPFYYQRPGICDYDFDAIKSNKEEQ
jgi:hypothetical protein